MSDLSINNAATGVETYFRKTENPLVQHFWVGRILQFAMMSSWAAILAVFIVAIVQVSAGGFAGGVLVAIVAPLFRKERFRNGSFSGALKDEDRRFDEMIVDGVVPKTRQDADGILHYVKTSPRPTTGPQSVVGLTLLLAGTVGVPVVGAVVCLDRQQSLSALLWLVAGAGATGLTLICRGWFKQRGQMLAWRAERLAALTTQNATK